MLKIKVVSINSILGGETSNVSPTPYGGSNTSTDRTVVNFRLVDTDKVDASLEGVTGNFVIEIPSIKTLPFTIGDVLDILPEVKAK